MSVTELVVVSDTNIFIDLIDLELYQEFMRLGYTVHTNINVLSELTNSRQIEIINSTGGIIVEQFDTPNYIEDILQFFDERTRSGLSFTDCTVLYQGIKLSATVLTGDKKMINSAKEMDINVHGILFIFDQLVQSRLITHRVACEKLEELFKRNNRLPKDEIEKRLKDWGE